MSAQDFLREANNFLHVRSTTWQGPAARSGRRYERAVKEEKPMSNDSMNEVGSNSTPDDLWQRLIVAGGGDQAARRAVAVMQRLLLENVENMPLDEIEMIAGE